MCELAFDLDQELNVARLYPKCLNQRFGCDEVVALEMFKGTRGIIRILDWILFKGVYVLYEELMDYPLEKVDLRGVCAPIIIGYLRQLLNGAIYMNQFAIHFDLNYSNILMRGNKLAIADLEHFCFYIRKGVELVQFCKKVNCRMA